MPSEGSVPGDWFVGFHSGLAARFWRAVGGSMADADAESVFALLGLPPGRRVLDVPTGDGRIAVRLAERGMEVHGIDIAPEEVELAAATACARGARATFEVGDLRDLPEMEPFDGLVSWGNSFGYLEPADTARTLAAFHRLLVPRGRLVLDASAVAENIFPGGIEELEAHEFDGIRMTERNRYDPHRSRVETHYIFEAPDAEPEHRRSLQYVHTSGEVVRMLAAVGFADIALRGPDARKPYALGAGRLVVVATA